MLSFLTEDEIVSGPWALKDYWTEGGLYPDPENRVWRIPFCGTCHKYHKLDINGWCPEDALSWHYEPQIATIWF